MKHKVFKGFIYTVTLSNYEVRTWSVQGDFPPIKPEGGFFHFGYPDEGDALTIRADLVNGITYKMVPLEDESCEQPSAQ